jgi:hypothetical protein
VESGGLYAECCGNHQTRFGMIIKSVFFRAFGALFATALLVQVLAGTKWKLPPEETKFKSAPGSEIASASCILCHSADYISTQPPLDRAGWTVIVQKMREKYGAPIPTNNVETIVNYLATNYGKSR